MTLLLRHLQCRIALAVCVLALLGGVIRAQATPDVLLALDQRFGRALFSSCRLTVDLPATAAGQAVLTCAPNLANPVDARAIRRLSSRELRQLRTLVGQLRLPNQTAGDITVDPSSTDGVLETLFVTGTASPWAATVSGHPDFRDGANAQLLAELHKLIRELQPRLADQLRPQ